MFQISSIRSSILLALLLSAGLCFAQKVPNGFIHIVYMKDTIFKKMDLTKINTKAYFAKVLRTAANCSISCGPLPVKWLSLKGERKNDSVCLVKWETTNEANNMGFTVERSLGNALHFEKVGFVPASQRADAILQYNFTDANDYSGISYYRLRQTDADRSYNYSKVIAIKGYQRTEGLQVYPNPAYNQLEISISVSDGGNTQFILLDASGKVVLQKTQPLQKGNNLLQWAIATLAKGTYLLQAITPAGKSASALVIKN